MRNYLGIVEKASVMMLLFVLGMAQAWAATNESGLPKYTTATPNIANNSVVRFVKSVEWTLTAEGYDAPIGIMPGAPAITATFVSEQGTSNITGIKPSVKAGKLVVTFDNTVNVPGTLTINVPAGVTNNLAMPVGVMTEDEIIAEGGCTNPALTLTLTIRPENVKCTRITNARPLSAYMPTDESGKSIGKDDYGQYITNYTWQDLPDAQLVPNVDYLSYIYFWYAENFETVFYNGGATVKNLSNGRELGVANVEFKTGNFGDNHKYDVVQLRISSEDWIKFENQQGLYEVYLPAGVAVTADGMKNEAVTFQFKFGDPAKAVQETALDLSAYVGPYEQHVEPGEVVEDTEFFDFVQEGDEYFIDVLNGTDLHIPVVSAGATGKYVAKATTSELYQFYGFGGKDVDVTFQENEGKYYIYLDQFSIKDLATGKVTLGGVLMYELAGEPVDDESALDDFVGAWSVAAADNSGSEHILSFDIISEDGEYYATNWSAASSLEGKAMAKKMAAGEEDLKVRIVENEGIATFYMTETSTGAYFMGYTPSYNATATLGDRAMSFDQMVMISLTGSDMYIIEADTEAVMSTPTGINNINSTANAPAVMYNIAGQRVQNAKGLVIINGKKIVK